MLCHSFSATILVLMLRMKCWDVPFRIILSCRPCPLIQILSDFYKLRIKSGWNQDRIWIKGYGQAFTFCWKRGKKTEMLTFNFLFFLSCLAYLLPISRKSYFVMIYVFSSLMSPSIQKKILSNQCVNPPVKKCCQINVWIHLSKNVVKSMCESSQRVWQRHNHHGDRTGRWCWRCLHTLRSYGFVLQVSL